MKQVNDKLLRCWSHVLKCMPLKKTCTTHPFYSFVRSFNLSLAFCFCTLHTVACRNFRVHMRAFLRFIFQSLFFFILFISIENSFRSEHMQMWGNGLLHIWNGHHKWLATIIIIIIPSGRINKIVARSCETHAPFETTLDELFSCSDTFFSLNAILSSRPLLYSVW